ncbi:hypothetical protein Acr_00g0067120 [Actinidia rufa]|uniref:Uncharacterized protein n=1 Tax=Actinidia rufa TaxID=165716 RepID=A0A7J0DRQ2_9ERIC|nr:hypothetical protein Acr_00g0067120 [Actinidia rufa]
MLSQPLALAVGHHHHGPLHPSLTPLPLPIPPPSAPNLPPPALKAPNPPPPAPNPPLSHSSSSPESPVPVRQNSLHFDGFALNHGS